MTAMTTAAKNVKGHHGQGEEAPLEDDSPDQESRTRAQSSDESIGTPSLANTFISAADRWWFASAAVSSQILVYIYVYVGHLLADTHMHVQ